MLKVIRFKHIEQFVKNWLLGIAELILMNPANNCDTLTSHVNF